MNVQGNSLQNSAFWMQIAAFIMFLAIASGAFGAHGLEAVFTAKQMDVWHKATHYLVIHGLAIFMVSVLLRLFAEQSRYWIGAAWSFLVGVILFSGSLMLWALSGMKWLVFLTPVGGILFLIGWLWVFWGARKLVTQSDQK